MLDHGEGRQSEQERRGCSAQVKSDRTNGRGNELDANTSEDAAGMDSCTAIMSEGFIPFPGENRAAQVAPRSPNQK